VDRIVTEKARREPVRHIPMADLGVTIGTLELKNPLICGSGEHTTDAAGIRAALAAGAAAVVAKSVNESAAARAQLDRADYRLLDEHWNVLPWDFAAPREASLFCRSGLLQRDAGEWFDELITLDREAAGQGAFVIPSLILSGLEACVDFAQSIERRGFRALEVNIGAPHGDEAARGAIVLERDADRVRAIVSRLRAAVRLPLWIKLTGQSEDPAALAVAAREAGADAVILMGRSMGFLPDLETEAPLLGTSGAIGGGWALPLTARVLAHARARLGPDYPLLATNGARSGLDVARFLLAGASATELSSLVHMRGYGALTEAIEELGRYLDRRGRRARDLIGRAADQLQTYAQQAARPGHWQQTVPAAG
jgi:dihydroorotate dehydrogenase